ncbi:MAG: prepilin-type N-terminal cleavage/methylation domain-containing protein [Candidatus Auribacterota bacterium]|jgi:uncharacterized protein (TIGR02598 family)|nr:prepilin-type N-terminal cleavage/methylation domain-containing protein [Candidatus Auribacterota bacterium]
MGINMRKLIASLRSQQGFTLAEMAVAIAILAVGVLSVLALYPVGLVTGKRAEDIFISAKQARQVFDDLNTLTGQSPPFNAGSSFSYQKKFHDNQYFYLYRVDDLTALAIPGNPYDFPTNLFSVRLAIYTSDKYAGGTATSPVTPTGKAIDTYTTFFAKD